MKIMKLNIKNGKKSVSFIQNNIYYYMKDVSGIIKGIIDNNGKLLVRYYYSAYGYIYYIEDNSNINLGTINPIRYHGYYYDEDMELYYLTSRYYNPYTCRYLTPDSTDYLDASEASGLNLYAYCNNDPINYADPSGHCWDTVFDILFIGWDVINLITDEGYNDWKNWAALCLDISFAVLPFVTGGGGQVVKAVNVTNDILDYKKITVVGETMSRVQETAIALGCVDEIYTGFKYYDKLQKNGKAGEILAEIGGKASNLAWLYSKLRSGYQVVDIGIDSLRIARSSSYILERVSSSLFL